MLQWPLPYKNQHRTHLSAQNSKPRPDHPSSYRQTTSRPPSFVQWPLPYNDQYRAYRPIPNIKPRPSHPVECNGHCRTRITIVPISRCPTINYVLTTPLRKTVNTVERSVPYLYYPDAEQHIMSARPGSSNGRYCRKISTVPISRRQTANHVPTTRFHTMAMIEQG